MAAPTPGPCSPWIDGADVQPCCSDSGVTGSGASAFDSAAAEASAVLYELSGRRIGICEGKKVRPCRTGCACWPGSSYGYSWGSWYGNWGWGFADCQQPCGCGQLNEIELPDYPIDSVSEVKIDGVVLSPFTYRVDEHKYLVSLDNSTTYLQQPWPSCQNLALADDQPGTFSVTYSYGVAPPQLAMDAAVQLACQIYLACGGLNCKLPAGVTRLTRQGVTIDRGLLASWVRNPDTGFVSTGLVIVDAFLATYNPNGLHRAPAVWSPDRPATARRVGT